MQLLRSGLRYGARDCSTRQHFCQALRRQLSGQIRTSAEQKYLATLLIVGRPNVGKSTLFNRLAGRRSALVHDTPSSHVTRDYKEGLAQLAGLRFRIIDTSGLEPAMSSESVQGRATRITQQVGCSSTIPLDCMPCRRFQCTQQSKLKDVIASS